MLSSVTQYIFNNDSLALVPHFNSNAEVETIVLEKERCVTIKEKSFHIMDSNLRFYGSSIRGAKDGAIEILGKVNMPPIAILAPEPMIWIPLKAIKDDTCVWLNAQGRNDVISIGPKRTIIEFINGHTIEVEMSRQQVLQRIHHGDTLMAYLKIRYRQLESKERYNGQTFHFKAMPNQLNYDFRSSDDID